MNANEPLLPPLATASVKETALIPRILETEVMDSPEEAHDYDAMDHRAVNAAFVADFLALLRSTSMHHIAGTRSAAYSILDVGTGTALIPIALAQQFPRAVMTAVDLSKEMLTLAQNNIESAQLTDRICVQIGDAKALPFDDHAFDAVISNSILHHLPEPVTPLREMVRVARPGSPFFVRDLLRPQTNDEVRRLVEMYAADEAPHARRMFGDSLRAAHTLDEVQQALVSAGLPPEWASQTSDRHWTITGTLA